MTISGTSPEIGSGITPETLAEARSLVGVTLRRTGHNRLASRPAISRWARSIGDRNPLWLDDEYGPASVLGATAAPPSPRMGEPVR